MVRRCVRIYVEGGATGHTADSDFRRGWKNFLRELHETARQNGFHALEIVRGKGRTSTYNRFLNYKNEYPADLCVLLVDSEVTVVRGCAVWDVVADREEDGWQRPSWATEQHLYLMVPFVEAWLLTDQDALRSFYKRGLQTRRLPKTDLENRTKESIERELCHATRNSSRGAYRHGQAHEIIGLVRPENVKTLYHGNRMFETLRGLITSRRQR